MIESETVVTQFEKAVTRTLDFLGMRRRAYQLAFPKKSRHTDIVLADLLRYCHANEECPHTDPYLIGEWMGRRNVLLRFQRHLYLEPQELFAIYGGARPQLQEIRK